MFQKAGTSFHKRAWGSCPKQSSHPSYSSLSSQFDMQRITLEELKHILYHAFRDHLTMKDIENIIINEEESLNDTSGNCQTEFEGGRYPCFCFLPGWGQVNAFTSSVWKTCWLSPELEWPCAKARNPGLRLKDPFGKDAIGFFIFFSYIFPKLCIFAKPPLALSFLQWLSVVCDQICGFVVFALT